MEECARMALGHGGVLHGQRETSECPCLERLGSMEHGLLISSKNKRIEKEQRLFLIDSIYLSVQ